MNYSSNIIDRRDKKQNINHVRDLYHSYVILGCSRNERSIRTTFSISVTEQKSTPPLWKVERNARKAWKKKFDTVWYLPFINNHNLKRYFVPVKGNFHEPQLNPMLTYGVNQRLLNVRVVEPSRLKAGLDDTSKLWIKKTCIKLVDMMNLHE